MSSIVESLSYAELTEIQTALNFAIIATERKIAEAKIADLKSEFDAKTKAMFASFKENKNG